MKRFFISAAFGLVTGSVLVSAQPNPSGPYVRTGLGASFVNDISVDEFYGPVPGGEMKLDTGIRFDVAVGYEFNPYLSAEMEFGWTWNEVNSITGLTVSDGSYGNFPFLANVILQLPLMNGRLIPYIGGGVGGSVGSFDADYISNGFVAITGNDTDIAFAYQGMAGVRYLFNDSMSAGLAYKYMGTGDTTFYEGITFAGGTSGSFGIGSTATHSIQATFTFRF